MGKIVALVPARSGSTRVKNKNIRQIKGMPLIGIAVKQAIEVNEINEVYVSTDSELYAEIAQVYGAIKPFLRPADISDNQSTDYEVFCHFLDWYMRCNHEMPDMLVQIRPTAPVRETATIREAIQFMQEHPEFDSLRSVSVPHQTPFKMWMMGKDKELVPVIEKEGRFYDMPTQKLPDCYGQDGIVDIVRPLTLLNYGNMAGNKIAGLLEHPKTWDIDTDEDLIRAGELLKEFGILKLPFREKGLGGSLGIIQGRLTESGKLQCFPIDWKREFSLVRKAGYAAIECFRDKNYNKCNPLWDGNIDMQEVKQAAFNEGIGIRSICDDFVQQCEWKSLTLEQYLLLEDLLIRAASLGADIVVYPLFEKADLSIPGNKESFFGYIEQLGALAEKLTVRIALEISESREWLSELFKMIANKNVGLCVDTGNLYAAGVNVNDIIQSEELKERLFHVHLKDCNERKENVIPGEGKVNFESFFKDLYDGDYRGSLITETARGNDPEETAGRNKIFFENMVKAVDN